LTAFAILGLLQALFLPGLIATYGTRFSWGDRLIIAPALSLTLNYFLVLLLVVFKIYTQPVLLGIFCLEIAVAAYLSFIAHEKLVPFPPSTLHGASSHLHVSALIKISSFAVLASVFFTHFNSVFTEWDAIVSWNRWAKDWFDGTYPIKRFSREEASWTYPQAIPILYSIIYKFAGTTDIQNMARLLASYYPFWGLFCFWRLGSNRKELQLASSIAGLTYVYFVVVSQRVVDFAFSGYVDPVMAAFGAFLLYAICFLTVSEGQKDGKPATKPVLLILLACVSGTALVKQNGVLMAFLFLAILANANRSTIRKDWSFWLLATALTGAISLHWYIFKLFEIWRGADTVGYGGGVIEVLFWDRPWWAALKLFEVIGWVSLAAMIASLFQKPSRNLLAFLLAPLFLFWAFFVSYDLRSAYVCYPLIAAAIGLGFTALLAHAKHEKTLYVVTAWLGAFGIETIHRGIFVNFNIDYLPAILLMSALISLHLVTLLWMRGPAKTILVDEFKLLLVSIFLGILSLLIVKTYVTDDALLAQNETKRNESNDHGFNQLISEIFKSDLDNSYILSSWQLLYNLPATEDHYLFRYCGDVELLARPNINYYLHDPTCDPATLEKARTIIKSNSSTLLETLLPDNFVLLSKVRLPVGSIGHVDFRKKTWPGTLINASGIAAPEDWGTWSVGKEVRLDFATELPKNFRLSFTARAFGPNVDRPFAFSVGPDKKEIVIGQDQKMLELSFQTDGHQKTLTIEIPEPTSPQKLGLNADGRQLGVALYELHIIDTEAR